MRATTPIPGNDVIACCWCINITGTRVMATHLVNEAGRSFALCDEHRENPVPPTHPNQQNRKTT